MVLLGLLLIVVAAAAMIEVSVNDAANTTPITIWERTFNLSPFELFIAGAVTAAVFLIGLLLVSGGMRRAAVKRKRLREARLAERDRVSRLEAEKRDLERRLETENTTTDVRDGVVDRDRDGVDDREETATGRNLRPAADRDADGVDDRDEATTPPGRHHVSVPAQQASDQLVAGGRRSSENPANRA
ncbi:hypothetical protein N5079_16965 [Planotetraspora sp. A-T 1434]|uniref:hypothetical protein n=1 Tax=Planotetraspora sp. A-T 1434 TaxID=2979219 RepID=UPI0021C14D91|nr:hypothetical protein [Planotetraspora sp. A-T 1434]MCT9931901.1 hypothetical protein [Planotetraspora sp. A-T 1434]